MSSFDSIPHAELMKSVSGRVSDRHMLHLIKMWLQAPVEEIDDRGHKQRTTRNKDQGRGCPQGAPISPLLGNVYLHYVFDLWVQQWRTRYARGDVIVVRYADDIVMGLQHRAEAERFLRGLKERFGKFGLALHPDKTRLIEFGRFAADNRRKRSQGKPETFDFLGFTHACGRKRKGGFTVTRKTMATRLRAKLAEVKAMLMRCRHSPLLQQASWLGRVVRGYFNYHAIPGNRYLLDTFRTQVIRHWLHALRRRSQKHRLNWARFAKLVTRWIPKARTLHPYPSERFYAIHPSFRHDRDTPNVMVRRADPARVNR